MQAMKPSLHQISLFGFQGAKPKKTFMNSESKLVLIRLRVHPFPSRTRKLSSVLPTILGWRRPGKIGNANIRKEHRTVDDCPAFFGLPSGGAVGANESAEKTSKKVEKALDKPKEIC